MEMNRTVRVAGLLLRAVAGVLFFQAGGVKLFGWFGGMPGGGAVFALTQLGVGAMLEFVGGIAMTLGLFTRPVAFILSGEMAVAYWQFHAPLGIWPTQNQGMPAILFCFIFLFFAAYGGGRWSIDAMVKRRNQDNPISPIP